jgi:hypothetical protein
VVIRLALVADSDDTNADNNQILEDLPYEELRERAFSIADHHHDIGFFYDLLRHLPAATAVADEGGSVGDMSASFVETISMAREMAGEESVGDMEPLFRARFATYIREHEGHAH